MLGRGAKDRVKRLFPEGSRPAGAYVCHDPDMRLVYAIEAHETNPPTLPAVLPPLTSEELAKGKRLREDSDKKKAILAAGGPCPYCDKSGRCSDGTLCPLCWKGQNGQRKN